MANEERRISVRREIVERAEQYGIKGEDDEANEYAIDQFKCWLVEHPQLLDAAIATSNRGWADAHGSLLDVQLITGKRLGDARRPEIRKSASIMIALGRACQIRANHLETLEKG